MTKSFEKDCVRCGVHIKMSNQTGKCLPYNLDGSGHKCDGKLEKDEDEHWTEDEDNSFAGTS
jgi:hypothetical protein